MRRGNAEQERWAVAAAALGAGNSALAVGHGPGVGLTLAAADVAPTGRVIGVDPSATMRSIAEKRCADHIESGQILIREGTAERTGCGDASVDAVISVNNVMLWERPAAFTELARVLRPGGRLVITVHRHVLDVAASDLCASAAAAGFEQIEVTERPRRLNSPAVELLAYVPAAM